MSPSREMLAKHQENLCEATAWPQGSGQGPFCWVDICGCSYGHVFGEGRGSFPGVGSSACGNVAGLVPVEVYSCSPVTFHSPCADFSRCRCRLLK